MTMVKKDYSPEALIQKDLNEKIQRRQSQQEASENAPNIPSPFELKETPTPPLGGGMRGSQFVRSDITSIENPPKPKPFMANYLTSDGRPLYGPGIQGWVRKLWGDLSDPTKLLQDANRLSAEKSDEIWASYNENVETSGKKIEDKFKWSKWGEKLLGVTSEEIAAMTAGGAAERQIADELGDSQLGTAISRGARIALDTTQNFIWGGLELLGMDDTIIRKVHSTAMGIDSIADRYNKDEPENFFEKILQSGAISVVKDLYTIHLNVKAGNTTWGEVGEVTKKYREGSMMAYTMLFDEAMRAEFDKGLAEGRDPYLLAAEYGDWKTELKGSIFGSPSTYLGLNIKAPVNILSKVARESMPYANFLGRSLPFKVPWRTVMHIPSFGEVFNISGGGARNIAASEVIRFTNRSDKLKGLDEIVQGVDKVKDEVKAGSILREAATFYANKVSDYTNFRQLKLSNVLKADSIKNMWGFGTMDSGGKVAVASKDMNIFTSFLVNNKGVDGTLQVLRDLVIVARGGGSADAVQASARLLSVGNIATSDVALTTGAILNKLDPETIYKTVEKFRGNPSGLADALVPVLKTALDDLIPSVDDMWDARKALQTEFGKDLTKLNPSELNKVLGDLKGSKLEQALKQVALAKQWDELPNAAKILNRATRVPEFMSKKVTAGMNVLFRHWRPASYTRDMAGNMWSASVAFDLKNAFELAAQSTLSFSKKATASVIDSGEAIMKRRVGMNIPTSARKMKEYTGGLQAYGMMPVLQRSDDLHSSGILVKASSDELLKGLPVAQEAPEYKAFINSLPVEQQGAFNVAMQRSFGVFDDALDLFRQWTGKGEIESWRLTKPSEFMRKELDSKLMPDGRSLMDGFYDIQNKAKNSDEFAEFLDEFLDGYKKIVRKEAEKLPHGTNLPEELEDWGIAFAKHGEPEQINMIADLSTSWHNTLKSLSKSGNSFFDTAQDVALQQGRQDIYEKIKVVRQEFNVAEKASGDINQKANLIGNRVMQDVYHKIDGMSINEMINTLSTFKVKIGGETIFSFKKIYPNIDLASLDAKKMKRLVIDAMMEQKALDYKSGYLKIYEKNLDAVEEIAKDLGKSVDEIAIQNKSKENPFTEMAHLRNESMKIEEAYNWQRFFRSLNFKADLDPTAKATEVLGEFKKVHGDWDGTPAYMNEVANRYLGYPAHGNSVASLANRFGIASVGTKTVTNIAGQTEEVLGATKDKKLLNIINDFLKQSIGGKKYDNLDDVPLSVAEDAFRKYTGIKESITALPQKVDKTKPYFTKDGTLVKPVNFEEMTIADAIEYFRKDKRVPPYNNDFVTEARSAWEGMQNFTDDVKMWGEAVVRDWGKTVKTLPMQSEDLVDVARKGFNQRMDVVRLRAVVTAESLRNFVLHDYQKTYADHAITYMLGNSFHYWTTRTYKKAFGTLLQDPKYANAYMSYKEYLMNEHSDMPEWYRQNLKIDSLFGIELNNPYFINLESMINPMYGLTGTDFNDPNKRVDWLSRTVDDMGKYGASFSPLIQWAVATHLYNKNEEDAASRWSNRLLPQSQLVKSGSAWLLNKMGLQGSVEIDPFVNFLEGGVDPYERNRVSVALAMMVRDGQITSEQMIEASRIKDNQPEYGQPDEAWLQANEHWKIAVQMSGEKRFMGDFSSFFFGAGVRPRTQEDMVVQKFWSDYGALVSSRDMMTPEQYRQSWDKLRENPEYGEFVDSLLISRKTGDEQDTAYAYNVLGRIPPGQMSDVAKAVGINPDMLQAFYDNKGQLDEMGLTPQDQKRFMAGIADIGAILAMPSNPTRKEWTAARSEYSKMTEEMTRLFGDEISQRIDQFFDADNKADYLDDFPEVQQALDWQTQVINQNQLLARYYGGIDSIQRYYRNASDNILIKEFGVEKMELYEEYSDPRIDPNRKKELAKILKPFIARRKVLRDENLRAMANIALLLPDPPTPQAQSNINPQGVAQNDLFQLTQPAMSPQQWQEIVGQPIMEVIAEFVYNGEDIPYVVSNNLNYLAQRSGYGTGDDMLMQIIQSLSQGNGVTQ